MLNATDANVILASSSLTHGSSSDPKKSFIWTLQCKEISIIFYDALDKQSVFRIHYFEGISKGTALKISETNAMGFSVKNSKAPDEQRADFNWNFLLLFCCVKLCKIDCRILECRFLARISIDCSIWFSSITAFKPESFSSKSSERREANQINASHHSSTALIHFWWRS